MAAQNPVYTTSSHDYGRKAPSQQDMPIVWNGKHGDFTKGGYPPFKATRLSTAITKSKVHRELDEF